MLLEEPELSLNDAIVKEIPLLIDRLQRSRKVRRQILVSTHSDVLLGNPGIDGRGVVLLEPTPEGTTAHTLLPGEAKLLDDGLSIAEVVLPKTHPPKASELSQVEAVAVNYWALATEDALSEAVGRRLLAELPGSVQVSPVLRRGGRGYLRTRMSSWRQMAQRQGMLVLTDLDLIDCPPTLLRDWLAGQGAPRVFCCASPCEPSNPGFSRLTRPCDG